MQRPGSSCTTSGSTSGSELLDGSQFSSGTKSLTCNRIGPCARQLLINMACATSFPIAGAKLQRPGHRSAKPSTERKPQHNSATSTAPLLELPLLAVSEEESKRPADFQSFCCCCDLCSPTSGANVRAYLRALSVRLLFRAIATTFEATMQSTADAIKPRARTVSSDKTKPIVVLNLPGVRLAVLTSSYDSLLHLDVTLSSAASLLLATYVACVLAWNILSIMLALLAHTTMFALISFYTFMGLTMLSMNAATSSNTASFRNYYDHIPETEEKIPAAAATPTLPLLCVTIPSKSTHTDKADGATSKRKEFQASPARRRVLALINRNRLLVNVVPGDMRRRADMNLGEANIRVGKAFLQAVPNTRKPRDIYVVRVDCGAQSTTQEKHMNPVIMWDVTATFTEFKQLERDLKKEVKAKKQSRSVKVPHLSSGAVLFVQPELTDHVLNARRARLQTFIDAVRSDPVLSTTGCLRKFCQAY